jgi:glycosyltransferase involved in cell wall biosynthesis
MNYELRDKSQLNRGVVLVHDSITQLGGAERVVSVFHEMFPESSFYTLVFDQKYEKDFYEWDIHTTFLQSFYKLVPGFKWLLPFLPLAIRAIKFPKETKIILSSSSLFLKALRKPKSVVHVQYCHTPPRFLWTDREYIKQEVPWYLRFLVYPVLWLMRAWDRRASDTVDVYIANSVEVQKRIKKFYGRDSVVVYPPVNTHFWQVTTQKQGYFLLAGRLQAHKGNELIIEIFNELGLSLHVVGTGRQADYLRSIAKPNIIFLGRISDEGLRDEYSGAIGYIYPQMEDAGLMPVEAAACGTATLGLGAGGSLETIVPGVTGEHFSKQDKEEIKQKILEWNYRKYSLEGLREHALKFSKEEFKKKILKVLSVV